MTPERIAEIRAMPHDNWRIVHELLDALDAANAELSRLRSSPAPVVGGVPELTRDDLDSACEWQNTGEPLDLSATVANLNKILASRLPALKPGEVEEVRRYDPTGWRYVTCTCKRCLRNRALLQNRFDREEETDHG